MMIQQLAEDCLGLPAVLEDRYMARRHIHYEAAFEDYLRSRGLPYYFGTVFLVPARKERQSMTDYDPEFRKALRSDPVQTLGDVRRKYRGLDARLAKLELYVTSPRFDLDQEFKQL